MSSEESEKAMVSLLTNKNFMFKILNMKSSEDVRKEFEKEGVKISDKEIKSLGKSLNDIFLIVNDFDKEKIGAIKKAAQSPNFLSFDAVSGGGVVGSIVGVARSGLGLYGTVKSSNAQVEVAEKGLEGKKVEYQKGLLELQKAKLGAKATLDTASSIKQVGMGALILGTALGVMIIFKDDIKAWFRESEKNIKK